MSTLSRDLGVIICLIDDILIYGNTQEEHDENVLAVLNRLEDAGLLSVEISESFHGEKWKF